MTERTVVLVLRFMATIAIGRGLDLIRVALRVARIASRRDMPACQFELGLRVVVETDMLPIGHVVAGSAA